MEASTNNYELIEASIIILTVIARDTLMLKTFEMGILVEPTTTGGAEAGALTKKRIAE
jgi:hypothetical protein